MKFKFSVSTTVICTALAGLMVRASFWQWSRHNEKLVLRQTLEQRIAQTPESYTAINAIDPAQEEYKRVRVSGEYDFANEIILRNRRFKSIAGVFVITPMLLDNSSKHILVSRGFIPLPDSELPNRVKFQTPQKESFTGLIKKSLERGFFFSTSRSCKCASKIRCMASGRHSENTGSSSLSSRGCMGRKDYR